MDEIDKQDVENRERMEDDDFKNVDVVTQKDKEIDQLKKSKLEQDKRIANLEHELQKIEESEREALDKVKPLRRSREKETISLPKLFQHIRFSVTENDEEKVIVGKVILKHKEKSTYRNIVVVKLEDGTPKEFDFQKM